MRDFVYLFPPSCLPYCYVSHAELHLIFPQDCSRVRHIKCFAFAHQAFLFLNEQIPINSLLVPPDRFALLNYRWLSIILSIALTRRLQQRTYFPLKALIISDIPPKTIDQNIQPIGVTDKITDMAIKLYV